MGNPFLYYSIYSINHLGGHAVKKAPEFMFEKIGGPNPP
jgi:hypothetical protein